MVALVSFGLLDGWQAYGPAARPFLGAVRAGGASLRWTAGAAVPTWASRGFGVAVCTGEWGCGGRIRCRFGTRRSGIFLRQVFRSDVARYGLERLMCGPECLGGCGIDDRLGSQLMPGQYGDHQHHGCSRDFQSHPVESKSSIKAGERRRGSIPRVLFIRD